MSTDPPYGTAGALLLACALLLLSGLPSGSVFAQEAPGKGPGLMDEIRRALSFRPAAEIWDRALTTPSAEDALPMMSALLSRTSDPQYAARAALWLGHYHYGSGRIEESLGYFEQSLTRGNDPALRSEAQFWTAHCRNLLGRPVEQPPEGADDVHGVLAAVAAHDEELRSGEIDAAWRGFLGLEGAARRAGCVGPVLYRLALILSSGMRDQAGGEGRALFRRWEAAAAESPDRALAESLVPQFERVPEEPSPASSDTSLFSGAAPSPSAGQPAPAEEFGEAPPGGSDGAPSDSGAPEGARSPGSSPGLTGSSPGRPGNPQPGSYYAVQLGAFIDPDRAQAELERLLRLGLPVKMKLEEINSRTYYKIQMGRAETRKDAEELAGARCSGLEWQVVRVVP